MLIEFALAYNSIQNKDISNDAIEYLSNKIIDLKNMSKIITTFESKIYLELTEGEAMALDAICGYGPSQFLEWFKRNHGKHYITPYEKHVVSLFDKARKLEAAVKQFQEARKSIREIIV